MNTYFADTFFYRALFDHRDEHHDRVRTWIQGKRFRTVTTQFVLTEVADEFRRTPLRTVFLALLKELRQNALVEIIPATPGLVDQGIEHYRKYRDKEWGLTDCISFVVMATRGVHEALTADKHFEHAGFQAVLKPKGNNRT
ncbi:MAG TPA: PIN domain-containing protein [Phycisphaerae bacterium]|nr:PIN domain-containing protein [Phycisphaerae bacterium]